MLRPRAINTGVESGKATARIEPDGYKKKLLASQTHLDLQMRGTCAHVLVSLFLFLSTSFSLLFFPSLLLAPIVTLIVSISLSFLRDILSPFLHVHSLFYSRFIFRLFLFLPFLRDYSSYLPIPLLHIRNLNYKCPSQSAATRGDLPSFSVQEE